MRRNRINRNRFDNRNPLGRPSIRYKRDASYNDEFEDFFEEFEENLDDILEHYVSNSVGNFEIEVSKKFVKLTLYQHVTGRSDLLTTRYIDVYGMDPDAFYKACKKFKKQLRGDPSISGKVASVQYFDDEFDDLTRDTKLLKNVIKALKAVLAEAVPNHMKVY